LKGRRHRRVKTKMIGQHGNGRRCESWSTNPGIRVALLVLLPVLTLATASDCAAQLDPPSTAAVPGNGIPQALTGKERWNLYANETFQSPWPYVVALGAGAVYHAIDYPPEWGGGLMGFGRRTANQFGLDTIQNTIHDGEAAALGYEPRYVPCRCKGPWRRTGHALEMSFLTYDQNGHKRLDLPQLTGAYGSGMLSQFWFPKRYSPLVQGVQLGHQQFGFVMATHLVQEFSPEMKRAWPFRKFLDRGSGKTK